jgi:hypothetical protein
MKRTDRQESSRPSKAGPTRVACALRLVACVAAVALPGRVDAQPNPVENDDGPASRASSEDQAVAPADAPHAAPTRSLDPAQVGSDPSARLLPELHRRAAALRRAREDRGLSVGAGFFIALGLPTGLLGVLLLGGASDRNCFPLCGGGWVGMGVGGLVLGAAFVTLGIVLAKRASDRRAEIDEQLSAIEGQLNRLEGRRPPPASSSSPDTSSLGGVVLARF